MVWPGSVSGPSLIVTGPTASGKTSLAISLATLIKGEIVNLDSVQVYREFDIGSAKPPISERGGIPHHLVDYIAPGESHDVGRFVQEAWRQIEDIKNRNLLPILCGGTGMYLTSLLHGLAELPARNSPLRRDLEKLSDEELRSRLLELDAQSANKIHHHDRVRMIRAIESSTMSGSSHARIIGEHRYSSVKVPALILVLLWPRDALYSRINRRVEEMLEGGLIDETKSLMERYGENIQGLDALGYSQCREYLKGKLPLEDLGEEISKGTRRFAKRQLTFWRNEPSKRGWIIRPLPNEPSVELAAEEVKGGKSFSAYDFTFDELKSAIRDWFSVEHQGIEVWFVNGSKIQ